MGIAGSSPERARPKARTLNIDQVYPDWQALVDDPAVDVVHITSPNSLHYPMAKAAIAAGKHVVCEKPLAMDAHESADLLRRAREAGIVHAVNYNIRFYPICHEARARVARGDLGDVYVVQGSYLQDWLCHDTDWNWRLEPALGGHLRTVGDIGTHWLDLTGFITGLRVEAVMADFSTFITTRKKPSHPIDTFAGKTAPVEDYVEQSIDTEDCAIVMLAYEGGARGVMTISQISAGRKNRLAFEIDGSRSALAWDSEQPNELWVGHRDRPNERLLKDPSLLTPQAQARAGYPGGHNEGFPDTFKQLYQAVYGYIQAGDRTVPPDFPTFADGHEQMLLCQAIARSAHEKAWVKITR